MKTDIELLSAFCESGANDAFEALVRRHLDWVYTVALRQVGGDVHLAEDVCQEVFSSLARKAKTLTRHPSLNGWLFRAARFAASDLVRSERRRKDREWELASAEMTEVSVMKELDWDDAGELLDEAIGELNEEDRDAICMRFFEESSFGDLGKRLGLKENAARMRVNRAVEKLQGILEKRGVKSTAAALGAVFAQHQMISAPAGLASSVSGAALASSAASIGMLGTSKLVGMGLAALAALGIGVAIQQSRENQALREEILALKGGHGAHSEEVVELGQKLAAAQASVFEVENEESPALSKDAPRVEEELGVMARLKRADAWKEEGRLEEALEEYFWLFDNGERERQGFGGLRTSSVLESIVEIGQTIPEALSGLRQRRDEAEANILTVADEDAGDVDVDVAAWACVNRLLGESKRSLAVFDQIGEGHMKGSLRIYLKDDLMEEKRYEDAIRPGYLGVAKFRLAMVMNMEPPANVTGERRAAVRGRKRKYALRAAASDIELLAGAKRWVEAVELTKDLLVFDSSEETIEALTRHLERADALQILEQLD